MPPDLRGSSPDVGIDDETRLRTQFVAGGSTVLSGSSTAVVGAARPSFAFGVDDVVPGPDPVEQLARRAIRRVLVDTV